MFIANWLAEETRTHSECLQMLEYHTHTQKDTKIQHTSNFEFISLYSRTV
jgi:hypothetical protein